ncbi:unnamed protein product, partial [Rotaria magnacalcarata]
MNVYGSKTKDTLTQCGVGVQSESGKLDVVLMHRPGQELLRLTKDNLHQLLYDAIPNLSETHQSHDIFSQYLRDNGVHVLYLADLLHETLASSDEACQRIIDGIVANSHFDSQVSTVLREWLNRRTPSQLATAIITGVGGSKDELGTSEIAQTLFEMSNSFNDFIIPPLPNLLFVRDGFSIIEINVFIWQMTEPARRNEPLLLRTIFQYHPCLSESGLKIVEWSKKDGDFSEHSTIEGGDIAYLGNGVLLIGCGERTNRAGIEELALTDLFRRIIVIYMPPCRSYMHLDTILSSVGKHAFTLHSPLAEIMEVFTVENRDSNGNLHSNPKWISHGSSVPEALKKLLNNPELIFYDALDTETSTSEQRQCRHNVVCLDDHHVVTYAGSDSERGIIAQMTSDSSCRVGLIPPQGLYEGGGG